MFESVKGKGGGPGRDAVSACEMTTFVSALRTLMTVPETVPVTVTDPAGGGAVVLPSLDDPPPLHEARPSKSVTQATALQSDWFHPGISDS